MPKKLLTIFEKICISLSLTMFIFIYLAGGVANYLLGATILNVTFLLLTLFIVGGFVLTWVKAKYAYLIGTCFFSSGLVFNFLFWFLTLTLSSATMSAFIYSTISLVMYIASIILRTINNALGKASSMENLDDRVEKYKEYKKLFDEGLINEEELECKKVQLLNVKPTKKQLIKE